MIKKKNKFRLFKKINKYTGMLKLANIDDKEEYLKIKKTINQIVINIKP